MFLQDSLKGSGRKTGALVAALTLSMLLGACAKDKKKPAAAAPAQQKEEPFNPVYVGYWVGHPLKDPNGTEIDVNVKNVVAKIDSQGQLYFLDDENENSSGKLQLAGTIKADGKVVLSEEFKKYLADTSGDKDVSRSHIYLLPLTADGSLKICSEGQGSAADAKVEKSCALLKKVSEEEFNKYLPVQEEPASGTTPGDSPAVPPSAPAAPSSVPGSTPDSGQGPEPKKEETPSAPPVVPETPAAQQATPSSTAAAPAASKAEQPDAIVTPTPLFSDEVPKEVKVGPRVETAKALEAKKNSPAGPRVTAKEETPRATIPAVPIPSRNWRDDIGDSPRKGDDIEIQWNSGGWNNRD